MLESINALKALIREETPNSLSDQTKNSDKLSRKKPDGDDNNANKRRKLPEDEDRGYFPAVPIHHEFFDPSIARYFKETSTKKKEKKAPSKDSKDITNNKDISNELDNILLENIYRLFGITLFPLVNPDRFRNNKVNELMGVRIEIFDKFKGVFETPYYLILQKNHKNKWITFKRTIPVYVSINNFIGTKVGVSDTDLIFILKSLRDELVELSFKRQLFRHLESEASLFVINETDYKFETVIIDLTLDSGCLIRTLLKLDNKNVLSARVLDSNLPNEKDALKACHLLVGSLKSFEKKIEYIKSQY